MLTDTQLHALGKVELHCHLDGSLSLPAIRQLATMADIAIPAADADLISLVRAPDTVTTLEEYLKTFDFIAPLLQTKAALTLAAHDVLAQAAAENVRYIEVRFAPELSTFGELSYAETIDAVLLGLRQGMDEFDIQAQALICGMRQSSDAINAAVFAATAPFLSRGVAGGDFAGNEADFPTHVVTQAIASAQALHIPLTFHAGEDHCPQNIAEAIGLGIRRIGHGTACYDQPDLIQQIVQTDTTVELCLTSNLQTKAAANLAAFPYWALREAGAKITINTDNRTVSNTSLTREYGLFQEVFGVTKSDFLEFNLNAVNAAFIDKPTQQQLTTRLMNDYR
ncbi:adenosine deaminase [Lacticaseibacillus brantae]|uniref:adenosine deaminase n=1 Tax=Lacticaseibacillus brantae DSM 23927 TaxID=1423727 RepID=A0A0R2B7H3_9LACO|nr:adenosine deaminase [Lacticaseibacillus brantae]KRM72022.1 adenosine deaminase [Lacticaseibacillus brantae DSM 23927]